MKVYTFEVFCGSKFGGWRKSLRRFETLAEAAHEARTITAAEKREGIAPLLRRAVKDA